MQQELAYIVVSEEELNDIAAGRSTGYGTPWPAGITQHLSEGTTGVLYKKETASDPTTVQPVALVIREDQLRRLFGRFAQLRSDLSPLSAWCHVLTPDRFYQLHSAIVEPELNGLE